MGSLWTSATFPVQTFRKPDSPFSLYIQPKSARLISWWTEYLADVPPSIYIFRPPRKIKPHFIGADIDNLDDAYTTFFCGSFFRSSRRVVLNIINQDLDVICSDPTPFPNLRDLRINSQRSDFDIPRLPLSAFPSAPRLVHLHLSHTEEFEQRLLYVFPWSQLTHIYMPRTIVHDCLNNLMKLCTSLKLAAFILKTADSAVGLPQPAAAPVATRQVSTLRHLVIAVSIPSAAISRSLDSLYFPMLTALRICSIAYPIIDFMEVHKILGKMPVLEELHFDSILSFADGPVLPYDFAPAGRTLSDLVPRLRLLVIDFIDPSRDNVGANIINFLQSAWLCRGWREEDVHGTLVRRRLEFVVDNDSLEETEPIPHEIIAEVKAYLESGGNRGLPFEVSITDGYSISDKRHTFEVFDEKLPSRGWDSSVQFTDKL